MEVLFPSKEEELTREKLSILISFFKSPSSLDNKKLLLDSILKYSHHLFVMLKKEIIDDKGWPKQFSNIKVHLSNMKTEHTAPSVSLNSTSAVTSAPTTSKSDQTSSIFSRPKSKRGNKRKASMSLPPDTQRKVYQPNFSQ